MNIPLSSADKYAKRLMDILGPFCDKIAVAGSIRRRRPVVGDIDLVILAKDPEIVKARCRQTCSVVTNGVQNFICMTSTGVQIDIFFARYPQNELFVKLPGTFGSLLLCRTGAVAHNIYLVEHAKTLGLKWDPYAGV